MPTHAPRRRRLSKPISRSCDRWRMNVGGGSKAVTASIAPRQPALTHTLGTRHRLTFSVPWRGCPEEGRRGGFDSHEASWAPEPRPGSSPGRHLFAYIDATNRTSGCERPSVGCDGSEYGLGPLRGREERLRWLQQRKDNRERERGVAPRPAWSTGAAPRRRSRPRRGRQNRRRRATLGVPIQSAVRSRRSFQLARQDA
jgi:hypothetical protein